MARESSGFYSVQSTLEYKVVKEDKDAHFSCEVSFFVPGAIRTVESNSINITVYCELKLSLFILLSCRPGDLIKYWQYLMFVSHQLLTVIVPEDKIFAAKLLHILDILPQHVQFILLQLWGHILATAATQVFSYKFILLSFLYCVSFYLPFRSRFKRHRRKILFSADSVVQDKQIFCHLDFSSPVLRQSWSDHTYLSAYWRWSLKGPQSSLTLKSADFCLSV